MLLYMGKNLLCSTKLSSDNFLYLVRLSSTGLAAKVIDSNAVVTSKSDQAVHDNAADNGCMGTLVCKKKQSLVEQLSAVRREKEARIDETDYYFENGFRKVYPYYHTFATFCKGRWVGRTLYEVFANEFRYLSDEGLEEMRKSGRLQLNLKPIKSLDRKLKENDMLTSRIHFHEESVTDADIKILHDDDDYLVVDKPSSIPIHPTARYRYNSLSFILRKEFRYENLRICHRLDKLTSGVVIFGKTKAAAHRVSSEISERKVEKEYLCKVVGEFPYISSLEAVVCDQPITVFDRVVGCSCAWKVDGYEAKSSCTHFYRLSTDGETSVVLCKPKTGRTHQIRVHLQYLGYPIVNDPLYNHEAWGEERFQHGPGTRDVHKVVRRVSDTYHFDPYIREKIANNSCEQKVNLKRTPASRTPQDSYYCPNCSICENPLPDPSKKDMIMYLHAYKYKGQNWEFTGTKPFWAKGTS